MNYNRLIKILILFSVTFFSNISIAGQHTNGLYTIHYSLLNSSFIQAETANQYKIKRSKNIALLNISIIKNIGSDNGIAVIGNIFGNASNQLSQLKKLAFKEIKETDAIYYIATFPINNAERVTIDIEVQPEKKGQLIPIKFKQQVYID